MVISSLVVDVAPVFSSLVDVEFSSLVDVDGPVVDVEFSSLVDVDGPVVDVDGPVVDVDGPLLSLVLEKQGSCCSFWLILIVTLMFFAACASIS